MYSLPSWLFFTYNCILPVAVSWYRVNIPSTLWLLFTLSAMPVAFLGLEVSAVGGATAPLFCARKVVISTPGVNIKTIRSFFILVSLMYINLLRVWVRGAGFRMDACFSGINNGDAC